MISQGGNKQTVTVTSENLLQARLCSSSMIHKLENNSHADLGQTIFKNSVTLALFFHI